MSAAMQDVIAPAETRCSAGRFDYSSLDHATADRLKAGAARVRKLVRDSVGKIIEVGRELLTAKERLGHGHFLAWIEAECHLSRRTASRFIEVAQRVGDKVATVANLEPTAVYLISARSTPRHVADEVIGRLNRGENVSLEQIRNRIALAKNAKKSKELSQEERDSRAAQREASKRELARKLERGSAAVEEAVSLIGEHLPHEVQCRLLGLLDVIDQNQTRRVNSATVFARLRTRMKNHGATTEVTIGAAG